MANKAGIASLGWARLLRRLRQSPRIWLLHLPSRPLGDRGYPAVLQRYWAETPRPRQFVRRRPDRG